MKKANVILNLIILLLCLTCYDVLASTKVKTRTDGNYIVPHDVIVTESNKKAILSTPAINTNEKIYDFADILSDSEEATLYNSMKHFIDSTNIDYVIVTISKNSKNSMRDYANDFYNYNDFSNDGILLLIDRYNKGIYMLTSGEAVEIFPDSRMEPILKNVFLLTKQNKFFESCKSFTNSISEFVKIGSVNDDEVVKVGEDGTVKVSQKYYFGWIFLFALVGTVAIMTILFFSNKVKKPVVFVRSSLYKDTAKIVVISESLLSSKTFKASIASKKLDSMKK